MTEYAGARSLDAEIVLDFIKKNVTMDYSLNKFGSSHASNTSVTLNSTFRKLSFHQRLVQVLTSYGILILLCIPIMFVMPFMSFCTEHKLITNPKIHYRYQKILKYSMLSTRGMSEQERSGELPEPKLIFTISNNVWFEYDLSGEYHDKIKSVSLKRRLLTHYTFGTYPKQQQNGWNVIFEFTDIPKSGSCILRHTA
jgi:hypothetical protein